jgi:ABC-2 type transport system permease protein
MTALLAIAGRELGSMFRTPVGWIVTALYALLTAVIFTLQTIDPGAPATLRYFFTPAAWLLLIVAPALSMRLFSEEYKAGTIEPLATAPVGPMTIVLGKYLGALASVVAMLLPTLAYPVVLAIVADGPLDAGAIASGYLGLLFVAMLYLALGTLVSTTTDSQVLAFLVTLIGLVLVMVLAGPAARHAPAFLLPALNELSAQNRAAVFAAGVFETRHAVFFVAFSGALLACAYASITVREGR